MFLVFATYNPSKRSFYHWATGDEAPDTLESVIMVALIAGFAFIIRSSWRSLKLVGLLIGAVFMTSFSLMLSELGVLNLEDNVIWTLTVQTSIATVLAVGVSFSAIRARLAGQIDSDDVGR
tara:strand:- start:321 stop:683 length:363 start_codon:yes stop_codon:yes gene_type:complete